MLIYLTGDQEEGERAEEGALDQPTNQPSERAPSAGERAGGLPAAQQPPMDQDQGERGAQQQLPDGTTREPNNWWVRRAERDPRVCFEYVVT